jgi:signal transduction histidine kinase
MLIADDETLIRKRVRLMLGDKYRIDEVGTAREALTAMHKDYDVIFLDIMFPDGNGLDVCRQLKEKNQYSTIIISSSLESVEAWDQAFQAGADGYLEKRELQTLDPRKIDIMIRNLVENNILRRKAQDDNQRQKELLQILSHDVRAPFQALLGTIDILMRKSIPDSVLLDMENLHQTARDQLDFINSLLELLRLESGDSGIRSAILDLNLPVNQALQALKVLANAKEISLQLRLTENLPHIAGDLGRICQLCGNLLGNAVKFTPRGGNITVSTQSCPRRDVPGVELSVADTGVGIKDQYRQEIFERFFRGRQRGTEGEKGAGLGLSICREIMNRHGGILEIDRGADGGTVARAWFPASHSNKDKIGTTIGNSPRSIELQLKCRSSEGPITSAPDLVYDSVIDADRRMVGHTKRAATSLNAAERCNSCQSQPSENWPYGL